MPRRRAEVTADELMQRLEKEDLCVTWPHSKGTYIKLQNEIRYIKMSKQDLEDLITFIKNARADWMERKPTLYLIALRLGDWVARSKESEQSSSEFDPDIFK